MFRDVILGEDYFSSIAWAKQNNIVVGYNEDDFGPRDYVTREQLIAMFYRYSKHKGYNIEQTENLENYSDDQNVSGYALTPMQWAVGSGLIKGRSLNALAPREEATLAELLTIMMNFMEKIVNK